MKKLIFTAILSTSLILSGCDKITRADFDKLIDKLNSQEQTNSDLKDKIESINSTVSNLNNKVDEISQSSQGTSQGGTSGQGDCGQEQPHVDPPVVVNYTFDSFKTAMTSSKPTRISTTQTYSIEDEDLTLSASSQLVIVYGTEVNSVYSYSYEKLNEIITGYESLTSVVTGTIYSSGSQVGDGVNFISEAESFMNIKSINFDENYLKDCTYDGNKLAASVKDDKVKSFFVNDYQISDVNFVISIDSQFRLTSLDLSFKTDTYMNNTYSGIVRAHTTYTYNLETI